MPRLTRLAVVLVVFSFSGAARADACNDFYAAVSQQHRAEQAEMDAGQDSSVRADAMQAALTARFAVGDAAKAVRETVAVGSAAEVLDALSLTTEWWWAARGHAMEWSAGDDDTFAALFEHLAEAFLAIDKAVLEAVAGVCVLRDGG